MDELTEVSEDAGLYRPEVTEGRLRRDGVSVNLSEDSVRALQAAARMARRAGSLPAAHYPALSEALSALDGAVPRRSAIVGKGGDGA